MVLIQGLAAAFTAAGCHRELPADGKRGDAQTTQTRAANATDASLRMAAGCHAVMFALLITLGLASPYLGTIYLAGLIPIGVLLVYEHRLVRPDDLTRVNAAFFQVNGVISFGLLLLVLVQLAVG